MFAIDACSASIPSSVKRQEIHTAAQNTGMITALIVPVILTVSMLVGVLIM